ncbi:MAG: hypothetical protein M1816_004738 [Peltula sp. TS41687]|nr:MAG: hypothetical protein M1816_004738 [Peltula sp. TS41687]
MPGELPMLVLPGTCHVFGFQSITQFLRQYSQGRWDLDSHLQDQERADCVAFSTYLKATGRPLLDLSLFLTPENYRGATRPLCSALFPWTLRYLAPLRLRDRAKARCQHLGLSGLEVDSDFDDLRPTDPGAEPSWDLPSAPLDRPRAKVSSLLEKANRIRLDTLSENLLDPLQELLGTKQFLLSEQPSSLDCLAMGYLSLALLPDIPQPWLGEKMRFRFGRLCGYFVNLRLFHEVGPDGFTEPKTDADIVAADDSSGEKPHDKDQEVLPWADASGTFESKAHSVWLNATLDSLPFIKHLRAATRLRHLLLRETAKQGSIHPGFLRIRFTDLVAIAVGLSVAVSYLLSVSRGTMLRQRRS